MRTSSETRTAVYSNDDVLAAAGDPDGFVEGADLVFGRDVRELLGRALDLDAELVAEVAEDLLEVGVVGSFCSEVLGELACLAFGRGTPDRLLVVGHGSSRRR